jgi:hypothetical protein
MEHSLRQTDIGRKGGKCLLTRRTLEHKDRSASLSEL